MSTNPCFVAAMVRWELTHRGPATIQLPLSFSLDVKKAPKGDLSRIKDAVAKVLKHPTAPKVFLTLDNERLSR